MSDIDYRVENKYIVTDLDIALLKKRLSYVMEQDVHQSKGSYEVRSVYFDNPYDSFLEENEAGVSERRKYRIRRYNSSLDVIKLEIKEKKNGFTKKKICSIMPEECRELIQGGGNISFGNRTPMNDFLIQKRRIHMLPKIAILYERCAYVHPTGNVRITFDCNLMASKHCDTFMEEQIPGLIPILPAGLHVLEVKYDQVLPPVIAEQLEIGKLRQSACSKYYLGRKAIMGEFSIGR